MSLLDRLLLVGCPGPRRIWIQAMLAERQAIESSSGRAIWTIGGTLIVVRAVSEGITHGLSNVTGVALVALAVAGCLAWVGFFMSFESLGFDDDLLAVSGLIAVTVDGGILLRIVRELYQDPDYRDEAFN